ncbi:hypothetical protein AYK26_06980 [Euryarchaeota archaeon SM23-78]|nr:MAG: hypothetical protein AYK26_06980 [Euryarchaeota archaeon SM23-78]
MNGQQTRPESYKDWVNYLEGMIRTTQVSLVLMKAQLEAAKKGLLEEQGIKEPERIPVKSKKGEHNPRKADNTKPPRSPTSPP